MKTLSKFPSKEEEYKFYKQQKNFSKPPGNLASSCLIFNNYHAEFKQHKDYQKKYQARIILKQEKSLKNKRRKRHKIHMMVFMNIMKLVKDDKEAVPI